MLWGFCWFALQSRKDHASQALIMHNLILGGRKKKKISAFLWNTTPKTCMWSGVYLWSTGITVLPDTFIDWCILITALNLTIRIGSWGTIGVFSLHTVKTGFRFSTPLFPEVCELLSMIIWEFSTASLCGRNKACKAVSSPLVTP